MALTNGDKQFIVGAIKSAFSVDRKYWKVYLNDLFDIKLDEKFKDKLGNLPTKKEFYEQTDKLMKEVKDSREEQSMLSPHSSDHSDAIKALQKIHPHNSHPTFA